MRDHYHLAAAVLPFNLWIDRNIEPLDESINASQHHPVSEIAIMPYPCHIFHCPEQDRSHIPGKGAHKIRDHHLFCKPQGLSNRFLSKFRLRFMKEHDHRSEIKGLANNLIKLRRIGMDKLDICVFL